MSRVVQPDHDILGTQRWQADGATIAQNVEKPINYCEDVIHELHEQAEKSEKEPQSGFKNATVAVGRRAAYPLPQSTLEKLDEDVTAFKTACRSRYMPFTSEIIKIFRPMLKK